MHSLVSGKNFVLDTYSSFDIILPTRSRAFSSSFSYSLKQLSSCSAYFLITSWRISITSASPYSSHSSSESLPTEKAPTAKISPSFFGFKPRSLKYFCIRFRSNRENSFLSSYTFLRILLRACIRRSLKPSVFSLPEKNGFSTHNHFFYRFYKFIVQRS